MELQELVVRAITIQMRFKLAPMFADRRGSILSALLAEHSDLSDYGWTETGLQLSNPQRTRIMLVGSGEIRLVYEHLERIDDFTSVASEFFPRSLEELAVDQVAFLGIRSYWLAAVDSFDELCDWTVKRFSPTEPFSEAVGARSTDTGWVFEYRAQDPEHIVRVGPMKVQQLTEQILGTSEADLFPEQFLFVDIDRIFRRDPIPTADVAARMQDSLDRALTLGQRIGAALLHQLPASG
jgi:hypothetical protein